MGQKKIGLDKPVYLFILTFAVLFAYTVLTHYPPEPVTEHLDHYEPIEPISYYNVETIENSTDNGTVIKPISVTVK